MPVIVRFAPSPTGPLHVGSARTALFNFLFARQQGDPPAGEAGKFILRIDDTDRERSKAECEKDILEGLRWLGLKYDEIFHQSERTAIYKKYLEKLIEEGKVYQTDVLRFRNPGGKVRFQDIIRGEIEFDISDLGDFVVAKNLETPLYHFASVVDDYEMGITHVIRGEDHISNTPRQILLCQALGGEPPLYAHLPLILAPGRTKLSKRQGAVSVSAYRSQGYLPAALVNFLALLGWSPQAKKLEQEIFSLEELVKYFDLKEVQSSPAVFNIERLNWFNKEYLKRLPPEELKQRAREYLPRCDEEMLMRLLPEIINRIHRLGEIGELIKQGEWDYFFNRPEIKKEMLKNPAHLSEIIRLLEPLEEKEFTAPLIKNAVWSFASRVGRGEVLWPMRVALTGRERSPDPFTVASIIGKREAIDRLKYAAQL